MAKEEGPGMVKDSEFLAWAFWAHYRAFNHCVALLCSGKYWCRSL